MAEEYDPFADLGSQDPFTDLIPSFKARASGYHPVDPGSPEYSMEGGKVGAAEWHGQKLDAQEPLYTLDQYRKGKAPYVSVAMDNTPNNPLPYGEILESPDMPGIPFRVMDTGSAFNGKTTKYGGPKGTSRIDIARDTNAGANSSENNRDLTFQIAGEDIRKRIEEFPKLAGELTTGAERKAVEPADVKGDPFADLIPTEKPTTPSGPDPFADLTPPSPRGFKGLEPGQPIEGSPTPTPLPDITTPKPAETPKQKRGGMTIPATAPSPALTFSPVPSLPMMDIPTGGQPIPPPIEAPSALPTPQGEEDPNIYEKTVRALGTYGSQMVPQSVEQVVQLTGVPTDLTDPFANLGFLFPPLRPTIMAGQQALHRMQQIREAEQTPAMSQPRFNAGIGTVLDLAGMATMGGIGKLATRPRARPSVAAEVASTREVPVPEALQPRGATVSEAPASPVTPPIERPAPQLSEPLQFSVDMPTDVFGTEHTPVSSALHEMKVLSKSGAKKAGKYKGNEALWNDAPALSHPTHNKIYSPHGEMPDVAAQNLYDAGLISEPSVTAMWEVVGKDSKSARGTLKAQRGDAKAIGTAAKQKFTQDTAFNQAEQAAWKGGEPAIPVRDLQVGDTIEIGGEKFKVTDIDPDTFDVTLEDGRKFGIQTVNDNAVIYGEHESTFARPPVEPPETPPPTQPPVARPPPAAPTPPPVPQGSETVNPVRGSGKFVRSYRVDKELGDRMEGIGASRESGALRAETEARNLLDGLTPAQETDLGRYLVSRRLKTVNPDHPQIISDIEMRRIESDPELAKALDYYKAKIKPDIEGWRKRAGLSEKAAAGKEPEFISLIPKTMELIPQQTTTGRFINPAKLPRTTQFAQAAAGFAREYAVNMRDILTESYGEVIRKARTREFYDAAVRKGVMNKAEVRMPDGNFVKVAQFDDLPPQLQHDLTEATKANLAPVGLQKVGRIYQRAVTGAALTANPAELVNHMRRQLNLVAAKPPIGMGLLARLEALVPYFGPKLGAFKRTIMDNMSTPENQAILRDIYDAGGGSSRSFEELYGAHPKNKFLQATHKYTGLEWLQRKTQNLLFGIPKGYGIGGWDLRMRVQLEKIRRSAEGNVDPQRIREFANQIGQYGRHTSWAVSALRAINPYAATTLPMRLTELKTVIGSTGLKEKPLAPSTLAHRGETIARGTGGTILALTTANYLLSGKWPWENDKGHEFDLNTGVTSKDGKNVYVKLRAIAPEFSRPVGTFSIPELLRERTATHPQYLSAGFTGASNQAASLVSGPGQNLLLTAATGKVPYFLKRPGEGPELMDVAMMKKGERGQSRGLRQLKAAAAGVNPFGELFGPHFDVEIEGGLKYLEGIPGFKPFGRIFSTSYEKKHGRSGMAPLAIPPPPPSR